MKTVHDLSKQNWSLAGFAPFQWKLNPFSDIRQISAPDVSSLAARVPGSVQQALLEAGILPDWNQGLNARACEWVENRHWIYQTELPADWLLQGWLEPGHLIRLHCLGLDDRGWILINGREVAAFENAFLPHIFDLTPHLVPGTPNYLQIVFDTPTRWLGQFGYTSRMTEWKPRFNYTWDWVSRLVQIGIWEEISLSVSNGSQIGTFHLRSGVEPGTGLGWLKTSGRVAPDADWHVELSLHAAHGVIREQRLTCDEFNHTGCSFYDLAVDLWQPNGLGNRSTPTRESTFYAVTFRLLDEHDAILDEVQKSTGFKWVEWLPCAGAAPEADPWLCQVNGQPLFLQGFNWTPIRPNFADVTEAEYRQRLELYRDLGVNILRVWGGAFLEKECFYQICDELGLLVWQEFPLSSSGVDNWPPEDLKSIGAQTAIARSYIARRQHHPSLLCWCGGNELQGNLDGEKTGVGKPVDLSHPLIRSLADLVEAEDPERRFLPTSSSGPRFYADAADFGKGLHWDVHGPWKLPSSMADWADYWRNVDGLFHSEVGAPGASPVEIIAGYRGTLEVMPGSEANPLWRRTSWWIEWPEFIQELGREPASLEEFVTWSQQRQVEALTIVAGSLKEKFPRCGGVIFWMGHDCFPCTANTSVIDFEGNPKPAALALKKIFRGP